MKIKYIKHLAMGLLCASSASAQYTWTQSDSAADWGPDVWPPDTTSGNFAHGFEVSNPSATFGSRSADGGAGGGEAPIDGTAGTFYMPQQLGVYTRTATPAKFDMSAVGSTATIQTMYHFMDNFEDNGGHMNLFEFGLTNGPDHFGHANDESLFLAGELNMPYTQNAPGTYELYLHDNTTIDQTPIDGTWTQSPIATLASGMNIDAIGTYWGDGNQGTSVRIDLTYTTLAGGQMQLDYTIYDVGITGPTPSDTITGWTVGTSGSQTVTHNFSDLTCLYPAMGLRLNDSDVPVSGGAFDWNEEFVVIPEPSALMASLMGICLLGLRRRR